MQEATQKLTEARNAEANKFKVPPKPVAANGAGGNADAANGAGGMNNAVKKGNMRSFDEDLRDAVRQGMSADAAHHNGLFGQYQYTLGENGLPTTKKERDRALRYAKRNERYKNTHKSLFSENPFGQQDNTQTQIKRSVD